MSFAFTPTKLERPAVLMPVALLLLAVAGGLMWVELTSRAAPEVMPTSASAPATPPILVAAADIARGQLLTSRDFTFKASDGNAPVAALRRAEDAEGRIALSSINAGLPIQAAQLSAAPALGIAARVPEGYRAYALPVSEALVAGGFLQAGDHVDLYVALPSALFPENANGVGRDGDRSKSTLLLQDVTVLATGIKTEGDGKPDTAMRTVTLALKADDLSRVSLASRLGTVSFAIRNPVDMQTQAPAAPVELAELVGSRQHALAPVVRKPSSSRGVPAFAGRNRITIQLP